MYCQKCGKEVAENIKFCPECGLKMEKASEGKATTQLRCKSCGGLMSIDENSSILYCSYCGSKELMSESDEVAIQRIKSKAFKEVEMAKLKAEEGKEQRQAEKDREQEKKARLQKFKKRKLSKVIIVFFVICLLLTIACFNSGNILPGLVALVQTVLFACAWLMGMQFIKEKFSDMHILLAVIGFILIVPYFKLAGNESSKDNERYVWPNGGICTVLPQPKSDKGSITDAKDWCTITVYDVSDQDFEEYVELCKNDGFVIETEKGTINFKAYNEEGYKVDIHHYKSNAEMHIRLTAPIEMDTYTWPDSDIAKLLPIPESNKGKIEKESDKDLYMYVGETPIQKYNEYVNACRENGFTVGYQKRDNCFDAKNIEGDSLSVKYEGNNVMSIKAEKSDEPESVLPIDESPEEPSELTEESKEEPSVAETITSVVIRPEFKEAMDSYEKFFDEYCEFMKKYSESDDTLAMLADYTKFMTQYADTMQKMDQLGEQDMSDAESAYYFEVLMRINQKILSVAN